MARPAGFEPATTRLEGGCSIRLSYGRNGGTLGVEGSFGNLERGAKMELSWQNVTGSPHRIPHTPAGHHKWLHCVTCPAATLRRVAN